MNAPLAHGHLQPQHDGQWQRDALDGLDDSHLDWLEEEAIFILRETAAAFERPALLFSGG